MIFFIFLPQEVGLSELRLLPPLNRRAWDERERERERRLLIEIQTQKEVFENHVLI